MVACRHIRPHQTPRVVPEWGCRPFQCAPTQVGHVQTDGANGRMENATAHDFCRVNVGHVGLAFSNMIGVELSSMCRAFQRWRKFFNSILPTCCIACMVREVLVHYTAFVIGVARLAYYSSSLPCPNTSCGQGQALRVASRPRYCGIWVSQLAWHCAGFAFNAATRSSKDWCAR